MDTININVRLEDFICRIPAMFPYLVWNDDGSVDIHKATDSLNGCYGKIVDNMHMPTGVRLTNYVQVDGGEIPSYYEWNEANTIRITESVENVFSNSGAQYLRRVLWYAYVKTNDENPDAIIIDNVPQIVTDDSPEHIKTIATEQNGVEIDCEYEPLYYYYDKEPHCLYFKRKDIISPCTTYSYRTIIGEYYKYRNIVGRDNTFIKFVETGIGLIKVDRRLLNLTDTEKYSEVPDEIYLSQVRGLLEVYREYQTAVNYYKSHYLANGGKNEVLEEKMKKYTRMGGDNMTNWLSQMLQKAYDVATEYKCHADNKDFPASYHISLMLNKHTNILGLNDVYENEFVSGNKYYDGDILTYNGKTYVCVLDRFLPDGNNFQYIFKQGSLYELSEGGYVKVEDSNLSYVNNLNDATTTFVVSNDVFYRGYNGNYVPIQVTRYITGVLDERTLEYVFDTQHFVPMSELYENQWYDSDNLNGEKYRYFTDVDYLPSTYLTDYVRLNGNLFAWDEVNTQYISTGNEEYVVMERTNSKLRDLRAFRDYVNVFGVAEEPDLNKDWLFFYKVNTVRGLLTETDEIGNIITDDEEFVQNEYYYHLHAYGNVITSITYNQTNNTLTFEYVVGAHLKAKYNGSVLSPTDNTIKHFFVDFEYDENSNDGVKFTETYRCSDNTVSLLGSDFEAYVNGDNYINLLHKYDKFPFDTLPENIEGNISVVKGNGISITPAYNDLLHMPVVHKEWMDGLYFQPKVGSKILIDRGNGASFERHLRLGEIRTMEDLENYHNGGFFNVSEI